MSKLGAAMALSWILVVVAAVGPCLAQTKAPHSKDSSWIERQTDQLQAGPEKRDLGSQLKEEERERKALNGFFGSRGKKMLMLQQHNPALLSAYGFLSPYARSMLDQEDKRAPSGFFGMRGKKAPSGFFGMRGKKAPSGFLGMRGKKDDAGYAMDNELDRSGSMEMLPWNQDMANWLTQMHQLETNYDSTGMGSGGDSGADPLDDQNLHFLLEAKRAPNGFLGMRGKRTAQGPIRLAPVGTNNADGEESA